MVVELIMVISVADKYDGERYDPSLGICGALELKFDGFKLEMTGRSQIYSYPAVSGKPSKNGKFIYTKEAQRASFGGPIPEGKYWINPDELWRNNWYKRGSEASWGKYRVTIHPFTTTNTFKRGGFFIHGGKVFGSAGCIDLASNVEGFVFDLERNGALRKCQIHLAVSYSQGAK